MNNDKNIIDIYAVELSPSDKEHLLMAYYDYVSLVCYLEEVVNFQGITRLANAEATKNNLCHIWPWDISAITRNEQEMYADFVAGKKISREKPYCFVSVNHTSQRYKDEGYGIISTPSDFEVKREGNPLPHRIERYVAAYPEHAELCQSDFLIDGKFRLRYIGNTDKSTISDAFNDDTFNRNFLNTLDMLSQYPDDVFISQNSIRSMLANNRDILTQNLKDNATMDEKLKDNEFINSFLNVLGNLAEHIDDQIYVDENLKYRVLKETLASATIAPFENMILDALSILAEESHNIIKKTIGRRAGRNYLAQAEKEKFISSSVHLQDYLNIRHLIHHQWDTLDNIGKVGEHQIIKNASVRRRFLDSYAQLCDKSLTERIKSYFAVRDDFIPLVTRLNPFVFVREKGESNTHLFTRIKDYRQKHPTQKIYIEIGINDKKDKKNSFIRNLEKYVGNIEIIDKDAEQVTNLDERLHGFHARRKFVEAYSDLEYYVCQYALFSGQSLTPPNAWNWLKNTKFLTPQEFETLNEYRKIRNTLSHKYTDNDLNQCVLDILPDFIENAIALENKLFDVMPVVQLIDGKNYRAFHKNGKVVDIDLEHRKVLGIYKDNAQSNKKNNNQETSHAENKQDAPQRKKYRTYTEEYPNGTSITLLGTNIQSYRLNNGITLDINKNYLYYADGTKLYFSNPDRLYIINNTKEKVILDNNLTILKYIKNGKIKSIPLAKNDCIHIGNKRAFLIGKHEDLAEEAWLSPNGKKIYMKYTKKDNDLYIHYSDGTTILIKPFGARIWHNNEELTYANRKNFVDSYNQDSSATPASAITFLLNKGQQK